MQWTDVMLVPAMHIKPSSPTDMKLTAKERVKYKNWPQQTSINLFTKHRQLYDIKLIKAGMICLHSCYCTVRHKKLHPSYSYSNFANLYHTMKILAHRCTWQYPIAYLFDSLCKIENWEPAYQICYCLLSSRQQRKMWNCCCNARPQTSSLLTS